LEEIVNNNYKKEIWFVVIIIYYNKDCIMLVYFNKRISNSDKLYEASSNIISGGWIGSLWEHESGPDEEQVVGFGSKTDWPAIDQI